MARRETLSERGGSSAAARMLRSLAPSTAARLSLRSGERASAPVWADVSAAGSGVPRVRATGTRATDARATPLVAAVMDRGDGLTEPAGAAPVTVGLGASAVIGVAVGGSVTAWVAEGSRERAAVDARGDAALAVELGGPAESCGVGAGGLALPADKAVPGTRFRAIALPRMCVAGVPGGSAAPATVAGRSVESGAALRVSLLGGSASRAAEVPTEARLRATARPRTGADGKPRASAAGPAVSSRSVTSGAGPGAPAARGAIASGAAPRV